MFRDVLLAIRADECAHRENNHHYADLDPNTPINDDQEIHFIEDVVGRRANINKVDDDNNALKKEK